jgi:hypothetical protein
VTGCDYTIVFVEVFKIRKVICNNYRMLRYVTGKLNKVHSEHIVLSFLCGGSDFKFLLNRKGEKRYVMLSQYVCCRESAYKIASHDHNPQDSSQKFLP